jgi:hypothetical protein
MSVCARAGDVRESYKPIAELHRPQKLKMLDFSMYQPGIDFKCPYSNRPLKPLTP